jgi:hypothetical protein
MIDNTPGPAHFSSDEYSALCLFMAKGFDSCVELLVKSIFNDGDWDEVSLNHYIEELKSLSREMVVTLNISDRFIERWRKKLERMEKELQVSEQMKNVFRNIEAYPEQQKQKEEMIGKKKAVLTEIGWHRPIPELSEWKEGGPNWRKHVEFLRKMNKKQINRNDPEFQAWLNRPSYNYSRVKKYTNRRLPPNSTRKFKNSYWTGNENNYRKTMRRLFGTNKNAFVE